MEKYYPQFHDYLSGYVVTPFYIKRLEGLQSLRLADVLRRKNPYLFKAKNIELAGDLAKNVVDAFLSSQEETLFGNLLEGFAIHVAHTLWGGVKSQRKSLDLEFERDGQYFIVGIKSGTAWGNSDQIRQMKENYKKARQELRLAGIKSEIIAINGCIYGKDTNPFKADADADKSYFKYAGQEFWHFLSGDNNLFREIIKPIDAEARQKDEVFRKAYRAKVNELTADFSLNFLVEGEIDWVKLVDFVSAREPMKLQSAKGAEGQAVQEIRKAKKAVRE